MAKIEISWPSGRAVAELDDTPTARAVLAALPCASTVNTWGDEVYFTVPAHVKLEASAVEVVGPGTVCFWVEGSSLALPFGRTPASLGDECRLVSRVNVLGKLEGDARVLASARSGDTITVRALD